MEDVEFVKGKKITDATSPANTPGSGRDIAGKEEQNK